MLRIPFTVLAAAVALVTTLPAFAIGQRLDVRIVDRSTGETLTPILHDGEWWVAGRPGARYRVMLANRDGQRTLNVVSIDGVNAISGDTAAWDQTGYVLDPYQRADIDGWRKNLNQIAAFEFASLPDSYAARTGRPANVGVIGIAMFDEKRPILHFGRAAGDSEVAQRAAGEPAPAPATEPSSNDSAKATAAPSESRPASPRAEFAQRDRLGTAHGEIEPSSIGTTTFKRAQSAPDEIVTIHYDRLENLIAMGIVAGPSVPIAANPFPGSQRCVPDPPPRR